MEIAKELRDPHLEVMANTYLGLVHLNLGNYRRAATLFESNIGFLAGDLSRERFEMAQLPSVHSRTLLVSCLAELGEFAVAIPHAEEGMRIAESANHPLTLIVAHFGVGQLYLKKGEIAKAVPALERALELISAWNIHLWFPNVAVALGSTYILSGRRGEALALLEQGADRSASMGRIGAHSARLVALGEAYLQAGRRREARDVASRALTLCRDQGERGHEAWAFRLIGEIAAGTDPPEREEAEIAYREAELIAERLGMRPLVARCRLGLGTLYRRLGERQHAKSRLTAAAALLREMQMPLWLAETEAELDRLR